MGIVLFFVPVDKTTFETISSLSEEKVSERIEQLEAFDVDKAWDGINFVLTGKRAEVARAPLKYRSKPIIEQLKSIFGIGKPPTSQQSQAPLKIPSESLSISEQVIDGGFLFPTDLGPFGLATFLDDGLVAAVSAELNKLTDQELAAKFDPEEMNKLEVYPGNWHQDTFEDYLLPVFHDLRTFYAGAASAGKYVIKYFG